MSDWTFFLIRLKLHDIFKKSNIIIKTQIQNLKKREKIYHFNTNQRKFEVVMVIWNKLDFRTRNVTKMRHFIMINWCIHQEEKIILKYVPTNGFKIQ